MFVRQFEYYASLAAAYEQGKATTFVEFMRAALFDALLGPQRDQAGDQVNDQVQRLLEVLGPGEKSTATLMPGWDCAMRRHFVKIV